MKGFLCDSVQYLRNTTNIIIENGLELLCSAVSSQSRNNHGSLLVGSPSTASNLDLSEVTDGCESAQRFAFR